MQEDKREDERGGRLKKRLRVVRKRKRAQRGFECEVVVSKMRLVKTKEENDRQS